MDALELTVEQEAEAAQNDDILMGAARTEVRREARLLVSKENCESLIPWSWRHPAAWLIDRDFGVLCD